MHQQALLRLAGHFVKLRQGQRRKLLAPQHGGQAANHDVGLVREFRADLGEVLECAVQQEQRRGEFKGSRFVLPARRGLQGLGGSQYRRSQFGDLGVVEVLHASGELRHAVVELRQGCSRSRTVAVPVFLGACQQIASGTQHRLQRRDVERLADLRDQAIQPIGGAHTLEMIRAPRRARHVVENIAHEAISHLARPAEQLADLGLDPAAQLLDIDIDFDAAGCHGIEEGHGGPPEAARNGLGLGPFNHGDGVAHGRHAGGILLEKLEEATLEIVPRHLDAGLHRCNTERRRFVLAGRRPQAQVGEEQFGWLRPGQGARLGKLPVSRQQPQGLVRTAVDKVVEVVAQRAESLACRGGGRRQGFDSAFLEAGQQCLQGLGELGDARKANDGKRAARLAQMIARQANLRRIPAGFELLQRRAGMFERQVDLALDPGQRADVQFTRHIHAGLPCR